MGNDLIILIEDNNAHARLFFRCMDECGLKGTIRHFLDPEEAIAFLRTGPRPRLILLDTSLPRINGFEILKIIKGDANLSAVPVVIITSSESVYYPAEAGCARAESFIFKPFEYCEMQELVRMLTVYWLKWNRVSAEALPPFQIPPI
jgi:chemotaxis family two-component system response regulator Rcp1